MPWIGTARAIALSISLIAFLQAATICHGQEVTEEEVKAAYLYNFAKFIEWPAKDFANANSPLRLCVVADASFHRTLDRIVKDKLVGVRPVSTVMLQTPEQALGCHLLFISASHTRQGTGLLAEMNAAGVVTVGERKGFAEQGGIINFVVENDHVRFEVNDKAALQVGLHISSRLLSVAKVVLR
jgi:hypothetical protein